MHLRYSTLALLGFAALGACQAGSGDEAPVDPVTETSAPGSGVVPEAEESAAAVSILRPDVEAELPEAPSDQLEPLNITIGFPEGGSDFDAEALAALKQVMAAPQTAQDDWPIVLRAHGDSAGGDAVNMRAAEVRGLAVASWLVEQGIDAERIEVIVFGEQNPLEPNALPDGSPNEAGRALNRRVEVLIVRPRTISEASEDASETGATSVETGD